MTLKSLLQGTVEFNELSPIIDPHEDRLDFESLKEDMLQVSYGRGYLLDVGWYPSFDPSGCFQICVIKEYDWENPTTKGTDYKGDRFIFCACLKINLSPFSE